MIYPVILAFMATAVVIFLLTYFIPQFSEIFQQFGGSLPPLTQVVIGISTVVRKYFLIVAVVGFIGGALFRRSINTKSGKGKMEQILLGIPIMGWIVAHFALVRFSRMLGTLIGAGVPLVASLKVAREAIGNQTLADTVSHAIEEVQRGEPLSKATWQQPQAFPAFGC